MSDESPRPFILPTRTFRGATLIDQGLTLAIEFEDAAIGVAFVLVPADQALDLGTQIMVEAAKAAKLRKNSLL